jgi:hypothetical protein
MYKKGDWVEFINDGTLASPNRNKYLNSVCKIIRKNNNYLKNYSVVFERENGKRYYTVIGEIFLVKTKKAISHSRKLKLSKISKV